MNAKHAKSSKWRRWSIIFETWTTLADTITTSLTGKCVAVVVVFFSSEDSMLATHLRKSLEISVNTVESIISLAGLWIIEVLNWKNSERKCFRIQFDFDYFIYNRFSFFCPFHCLGLQADSMRTQSGVYATRLCTCIVLHF